jgi:DNA-directed RNA polymerase beta subunit
MRIAQAKLPVLPLLKALGATPRQLQEAWGSDIYAANAAKDEASAVKKIQDRLLKKEDLEAGDPKRLRELLIQRFEQMELDPDVTEATLGKPYKGLSLDAILDTTKKLLAVSLGQAQVDDRDSLAYQKFYGPEDLFAERLTKDYGNLRKQLLFKAAAKGNLAGMPSSALSPQVQAALLSSGLGEPLEEINPAQILDRQYAVSRMGEGGIPSNDSIPDESREVQPSHLGFIDPLRTPESHKAGVDLFLSRNARKGRDGKVYTQFTDKQGQTVWKTPQEVAKLTVTFPGELKRAGDFVPAMKQGREVWVKKSDVDLELPRFEGGFSPLANLVPLMSMVKGQRVSMASRMTTQALPLRDNEAPLVQSAMPGTNGTRSYEEEYAKHMGALRADQGGEVLALDDDSIRVRYADGREEELDLYNNYPFNRKTFTHQTALVKPGDRFKPGDLLARSNFTDRQGTTALGANFRTAYIPWRGLNFEDAIVISEGAAKRLSSEQMYQNDLQLDDRTKLGFKEYVGLFASRFDRETLRKLDDRGLIKPGTVVEKGDPLILAIRQRDTAQNKVHKKGQAGYVDASITWDHHDQGVVTDVVDGKHGPVVVVKSVSPMQVGDKMSGRYGDKGVIAAIVPDGQMPHDGQGRPFEVLLSPLGIQTRTNPAQKVELALGKLARHEGQPQKVEDWGDFDYTEWAYEKLRKAGLSPTEDVLDPSRDRKIKGVATGDRFFMKLHHTSESKNQARGGGAYTSEDAPAKGGTSGSKRVALLDTNALLAHGATETLRDVGAVRGQRNEQYWLQFMQGYNPKATRVPLVYEKFVNQLRAAGINVVKQGPQTNVMALTDKDVDLLAQDRELVNGEGVNWGNELQPIRGGLFDKRLTGGHNGQRWSAIKLAEPLPNPVMEEPIRRVLGLTGKQFEQTLSGEHSLSKFGTGPQAIAKALGAIDLDREISTARAQINSGGIGERDEAIRRLRYLKSAKRLDLHPRDWMLKRAPVLPPAFRPVSVIGGKTPLVSDPNYLYKELFEANRNLGEMRKQLGEGEVGPERLALYHAFKGVTGLGDPISQKNREKGVRGLLKTVFGSSPKFGTVQRKLISTTVDNVGRSVITPNPDFDMDTVGLPEDKAFDVYGKFVARRLKRQGLPLTRALQHIKDRSELARDALMSEMDERPVFINRAPVLHKFGIMAFKPRLVKGDTLQISPLVVKGFGADFDGDAMNFHVPTLNEASREAIERLLPSRSLLSPADFKTPVHMPSQDYVGGLYYATAEKSQRSKRIFRSLGDARKAHARGEIDMNDEIEIMEGGR